MATLNFLLLAPLFVFSCFFCMYRNESRLRGAVLGYYKKRKQQTCASLERDETFFFLLLILNDVLPELHPCFKRKE